VEDRTAGLIFVGRALGVVAAIALALAVLGLYSLMAFLVSQRTQGLGVRMALGATAWQVIALTTSHGAWITSVGLAAGAAAAYGLGRLLEAVLFGAVANSGWQLATVVVLVGAVALLASDLPARRTARFNPTTALRAE
jgi:putative ABC transport system permease protein